MDLGRDGEAFAQLLGFVEQTADFVGISDPWGRVLYLNPAARKRLGVGDASDLTLADLFPLEAFTLYYDVVRPQLLSTGAWSGVVPVNVADGSAVPMYVSATAKLGPGGETDGTLVYAHDLLGVDGARTTGGSDVDHVTGLLGRSAFEDRAVSALGDASRDGEGCALVLAALETMGEPTEMLDALTSSNVMRALAGRMTRFARSTDIVGRIAENQLALLLRGVRSQSEASRIARTVYESLVDAPVTTAGGQVRATVGCGVALSRPDDDLVDLIQRASVIVWHQTATDDAAISTSSALTVARDEAATMDEFRVGMSHGEVQPHAQPVVDLASGLVVGYQGLARWRHRRLGTLKASAFIGMIAETSLANQVDLYVARETAAVLALKARRTPFRLYTPVSKRLILDVRTEQYLREIIDAYALEAKQLCLQFARPLVSGWPPALRDALTSLRDAGVAFACTDVEHASDVQQLTEFGFCELHLSRRLTSAAPTDHDAQSTASDIAREAHDRAALVGATGVNDPQHRDALINAGCDRATGDLYGEPQPTHTID
jgi:EAL domain-containing protein (putative c-di-GMP-specific phosphodiesterase class I)/GGDEF domain-containing protein